jgi:hypothetical protein
VFGNVTRAFAASGTNVGGVIAPSDRIDLLLSTQRALLGRVGESLWGVCADLDDKVIVLTFYVRPEISDHEREDLGVAGIEVVARLSRRLSGR